MKISCSKDCQLAFALALPRATRALFIPTTAAVLSAADKCHRRKKSSVYLGQYLPGTTCLSLLPTRPINAFCWDSWCTPHWWFKVSWLCTTHLGSDFRELLFCVSLSRSIPLPPAPTSGGVTARDSSIVGSVVFSRLSEAALFLGSTKELIAGARWCLCACWVLGVGAGQVGSRSEE